MKLVSTNCEEMTIIDFDVIDAFFFVARFFGGFLQRASEIIEKIPKTTCVKRQLEAIRYGKTVLRVYHYIGALLLVPIFWYSCINKKTINASL